MTLLYFDPFSGASGDMILGALIDAGVPLDVIRASLGALPLDGWTIESTTVQRGALRATQVIVTVPEDSVSRHYAAIVTMLETSPLEENVRRRSLATFEILARAEAKIHNQAPEEVHFHEVGGADAIIDIVGACTALQHLEAGHIVTGPIATGSGIVSGDHGRLPLPAPAVTEMLTGAVLFGRGEGELITPTGAAILAAASDGFGNMPVARLRTTGYGAGHRDLDPPNVLRVLVADEPDGDNEAVVLETNLDDMNPELLPHLLATLMENKAQDAWLTPILMKKGRPGFLLSVLTSTYEMDRLQDIIYKETTTLGVRRINVGKDTLARKWVAVDVAGEKVNVKLGLRGSQVTTLAPEYDDARRAAAATGMPLRDVYAAALQAAQAQSPIVPAQK
jgi:uncharacterized protein (TIGR00299 family) protein